MSIRIKLFLTLLAFSIGPLALAAFLAGDNIDRTQAALVESTRERILVIADDTRRHLVQKHAAILERDRALVEIDVRAVAEAMRTLDRIGPRTESLAERTYSSADFDAADPAPPGLEPDPTLERIGMDGSRMALMQSERVPVFVVPAEIAPDLLKKQAALLLELVPTMRAMRDDAASLIRPTSQFAAFDDTGLHMAWPGKGGYPQDYDPRTRPWYTIASQRGEAIAWTPPLIDAPTGQVRFTCAAPVFRDDGSLLGVTAADIRLVDVLRELDLPDAFREQSQAMVVALPEGAAGGPLILATGSYSELAGAQWDAPIELARFSGDEAGSGQRLADRMREAGRGSIELLIEGKPWVWTWERLSDGATSVLVGISLEAADRAANEIVDGITETVNATVRQVSTIGAGVLALVTVFGFLGARSITKPVRALANAAASIAEGDLDARAEVSGNDELGVLAVSFNSMVPKLRDRLQVREALALAQEVQQNLLPKSAPIIPGFDVAARSVYCDETGGDYYDFFDLDEISPGRHAIVVGDVTGHGIAAALLMTTARALLHARVGESDQLAEVIGRVNRNLSKDARSGQFMTLFYLLIDTQTRRARWVSAGHDAAVVFDDASHDFSEYLGSDIPLGIEASWEFHEAEAPLPERGVAVIGTDGIWESRSPSGEMFGKDRMRAVIREHAERSADEIADAILEAVVAFREAGDQTDDITLVVLKTGTGPA